MKLQILMAALIMMISACASHHGERAPSSADTHTEDAQQAQEYWGAGNIQRTR